MILVEAQANPPLFVEQDVTIKRQSFERQKDCTATISDIKIMIEARMLMNKGP